MAAPPDPSKATASWSAEIHFLDGEIPSSLDRALQQISTLADQQHPPTQIIPFGPYDLLDCLAEGGMGVVYLARHRALNRLVALKRIRGEETTTIERILRFQREAQAISRLDHPNIIRILDYGEIDSSLYFTMPLALGGSLSARVRELTQQPEVAVTLVEKIVSAIAHAHANQVLHRDLKPSNILLTELAPAWGEPLVSDFGLARLEDAPSLLTASDAILGTPAFMSPEQATGQTDLIDERSDIWALGVILYQLLTGKLPFSGRNRHETIHEISIRVPLRPRQINPEIHPVLEGIVLRCLQRDRDQRYATADELRVALQQWLKTPSKPSVSRRRALTAGLSLLGALALPAGLLMRNSSSLSGAPRSEEKPRARPTEVLLDTRFLPEPLNWRVHVAGSSGQLLPDKSALVISSPELAMIELRATPVGKRYWVEADVRFVGDEGGSAGIYFAHRFMDKHPQKPHCFCRLGFGERSIGISISLATHCWQSTLARRQIGPAILLRGESPNGGSPDFRRLRIEVTPTRVRSWWTTQALEPASTEEMYCEPSPTVAPPITWEEIEGGGIGIFVFRAKVAFRRVFTGTLD